MTIEVARNELLFYSGINNIIVFDGSFYGTGIYTN